jgi:quercetin dioxygenase-like cupin family protein
MGDVVRGAERFKDLPWCRDDSGFKAKRLPSPGAPIYWAICASGAVTPPHSHDHDQTVIILSGEAAMIVDGEPFTLTAGSVLRISAGTVHSARYLAQTELFEIGS